MNGCSDSTPAGENNRIKVVATTTFIGEIVQSIGGGKIQLQCLMGPQIDPHLYKASANDLQKLSRADIVFYHGLHLEGRMQEALESFAKKRPHVIALAESLPKDRLIFDAHGIPDPHVWFDMPLWSDVIPIVVKALQDINPENKAIYKERGDQLMMRYRALDEWVVKALSQIPQHRRFLVSSHDAFNYFGRAYDFQVIGIQGISTVSEAGLGDLELVKAFIKKHQIPTIFVENSVSHATIERVAKDLGVAVGKELFSDALGIPQMHETVGLDTYDLGTYEGMVRHNVNALLEGLMQNL